MNAVTTDRRLTTSAVAGLAFVALIIDLFRPKYGLPPALSGHQNYFYWGPLDYTGEIMIVLDDDATDEREQFRSVEDRGLVESSSWAMPWEQRLHIFVCRDLKIPLRELWPKVRVWL